MSSGQGTPTVDGDAHSPHGPRPHGHRGRAAAPGHRPHFDEPFPTGEITPTPPTSRRDRWRLLREAAFAAARKRRNP